MTVESTSKYTLHMLLSFLTASLLDHPPSPSSLILDYPPLISRHHPQLVFQGHFCPFIHSN